MKLLIFSIAILTAVLITAPGFFIQDEPEEEDYWIYTANKIVFHTPTGKKITTRKEISIKLNLNIARAGTMEIEDHMFAVFVKKVSKKTLEMNAYSMDQKYDGKHLVVLHYTNGLCTKIELRLLEMNSRFEYTYE